jgi:hypothetical protein
MYLCRKEERREGEMEEERGEGKEVKQILKRKTEVQQILTSLNQQTFLRFTNL